MVILLPFDTVDRILARAESHRVREAEGRDSPITSEPGPQLLAPNTVNALKRAKNAEVGRKFVGPLTLDEFSELIAWCNSVGLLRDANVVTLAIATP